MKIEFVNTKPSIGLDYSKVYMNNGRGVCSTTTSPYGSYTNPSIDMQINPLHQEEILLAIEILLSYVESK